jgi:hypothetical protein
MVEQPWPNGQIHALLLLMISFTTNPVQTTTKLDLLHEYAAENGLKVNIDKQK